LSELQEKYGLPTTGKSPWASKDGKAAIMAALADHGITPETRSDWTRTATGNISLGGETLIQITEGTPAEDLGRALAELKGQRSLAQLALDSTHPDGFVHPDITMLQRSGRWSTTEPGLTIWTSRGEGAVEKSYFLPDSDDEVLLEIDYSNADARFVAAVSGDRKYAERFEPGADGHMINAIAAWGKETVEADPKTYRQLAKPLGHGWSYGGRAKGLASNTGLPFETAKTFVDGMDKAFSVLVRWQNRVRKEASRGYVENDWGRKLWVEKGREFTQAPALIGQNGTREIVCDALLKMPPHVLRRVKAQIHDAILFSVPKDNWEECRDYLVKLMETDFKPAYGGQRIDFPVSAGPAGSNWMEASHV
jgi:DNA polymerase-1